jgi:hypothetical protein
VAAAQRHMQSAMEYSTTSQDRGLYAGKLDLIKASRSNRVR